MRSHIKFAWVQPAFFNRVGEGGGVGWSTWIEYRSAKQTIRRVEAGV